MCDYFWQRRENGQGDLADVVRSGGSAPASGSEFPVVSDWHPPLEPTVLPSSSTVEGMNNDFGDPFVNLCDPLLSELTGIEFFHNSGEMIAGGQVKAATESSGSGGGGGGGGIMSQHLLMSEEMITKPRDIIPRAFQLSSGGAKHSPLSPIEASGGAVGCSADDGGVQISSTRSLGVKRRKNQAKKVVCIPAPAAATNRPSGEVVPSDLWAWRKYGQKPIKGSPYPRGYYRCSSSKGCSARKQVERSRTNPNMLVITYTSEHNHPWPTQRNALAGSTRSQASKNSSSSSKNSFGRNLISPAAPKADPKVKEEEEEEEAAEIDNEPMIPESNHPDDFFADLAELETDPMSPVFSKVLIQAKQPEEEEEPEDKGLGPLNMCKRVNGGRKSSGMMEDGTES